MTPNFLLLQGVEKVHSFGIGTIFAGITQMIYIFMSEAKRLYKNDQLFLKNRIPGYRTL